MRKVSRPRLFDPVGHLACEIQRDCAAIRRPISHRETPAPSRVGNFAAAAKVSSYGAFFRATDQNIRDQRALIDGAELAHLRRVLRFGPGDQVTIFDDAGWEHDAVIRQLSAETGELEILRSYEAERESKLEITLALGLTKGEKMDWVIEKATELGVRSIVPFVSTLPCQNSTRAKIAKRSERWRKIALSAAKQSGRSRVPEVACAVRL